MAYFERYKKYYDALNENRSIVEKSNTLSTIYSDSLTSIDNQYFSLIKESKWQEEGKNIISNNIITGIKNDLNNLNNFILNNLVQACHKSIVFLLPIIEEIKTTEDNLNEKQVAKQQKEGELASLNNSIPSKYFTDKYGNKLENSNYATHMEKIASVTSELSSIMDEINNLIGKLDVLCVRANSMIIDIMGLNENLTEDQIIAFVPKLESLKVGYDDTYYTSMEYLEDYYGSNFNLSKPLNSVSVIDTKFLGDSKIGQYVMVTLSNGLEYPVYQQKYYPRIKGANMGGGCSYFALASGAYYLLQPSMSPTAFLEEIVTNTSGQFGGMEELFQGRKAITIDGTEYIVDSDFSEKKDYGSGSLGKETVVADIKNTLESGGVVFLNIGKLTSDFTRNGVRIDSDMINLQTGIYSEGGHVIAMTGIDENEKIIFADSNRVDISEERVKKDLTYYDKGITVEEFYDLYGGNSPTSIPHKYYYTATHADLVKVNGGNLKASN